MKKDQHDLAACMTAVCDKDFSKNPVAWFRLHQEGITIDVLKEVSSGPAWIGNKPYFQNAPDRSSAMWKFMEAEQSA